MIRNLSAMQVGVHGNRANGQDDSVYFTKDTNNKLQIRIGTERCWVTEEDIKKAMVALYYPHDTGVTLCEK